REQLRTHELFRVPVREAFQRIPERDHLTLLGYAKPAIVCRRRHRGNGEVGATPAAAHGAAATVEQTEIDVVLATDAAEAVLRAVQRPVRHPVATILVAVRIAEHD